MNNKKELERKLAALESVNDQLVTELIYVHELMMAIGFTYGLESVKGVANEILNSRVKHQEEC